MKNGAEYSASLEKRSHESLTGSFAILVVAVAMKNATEM